MQAFRSFPPTFGVLEFREVACDGSGHIPQHHGDAAEEPFSGALEESVRTDVECCFGIVEGRFRALKLPILLHERETVHNMHVLNELHASQHVARLRRRMTPGGRPKLGRRPRSARNLSRSFRRAPEEVQDRQASESEGRCFRTLHL